MIEPRLAVADDVGGVVDLLAEAAAWLHVRGVMQWPDRFEESFIAGTVDAGTLWVVDVDGDLAGTVTLQSEDEMFWPGRDDALVVHRLCVARAHRGLGRDLLEWAVAEAGRRGRTHLRLDTIASNARMRRYYEEAGFSLVGEMAVPAAPPGSGYRAPWAVLYERSV